MERKSLFTVKRMFRLIFAAVLLLGSCSTDEGLTVHNAWMRPTAQGENGAVYFVLQNNSGASDELVSASSSVAESVEIHESSMVEGTDVMQMQQVFSVPLDRGSQTVFEPGGFHVMLVHVNQPLAVGDHLELTLHFKNHADLPLTVAVAEVAPADDHSH